MMTDDVDLAPRAPVQPFLQQGKERSNGMLAQEQEKRRKSRLGKSKEIYLQPFCAKILAKSSTFMHDDGTARA